MRNNHGSDEELVIVSEGAAAEHDLAPKEDHFAAQECLSDELVPVKEEDQEPHHVLPTDITDMDVIESNVAHMTVSSTISPPTLVAPSDPFPQGLGSVNRGFSPEQVSSSATSSSSSASHASQTSQQQHTYNPSGPWSFSSSSSAPSPYRSSHFYSSSSSLSSFGSDSLLSTPSLISLNESVYAAVPISSELYIIPRSSRGFYWNGDCFLKPHQRHCLGIDHMFQQNGFASVSGNRGSSNSLGSVDSSSSSTSQSYQGQGQGQGLGSRHQQLQQQHQHQHNQDSLVMVHEIRLDDQEMAAILPSWP